MKTKTPKELFPSTLFPFVLFDFVGIANHVDQPAGAGKREAAVGIIVRTIAIRGIIRDYLANRERVGKGCSYRCKVVGNADEAINAYRSLFFVAFPILSFPMKDKKGWK